MSYLKAEKTGQDKYTAVINKLFVSLLSGSLIVLFFLMMVTPRTYQLLKVPFLCIVLCLMVFSILLNGKIRIHRKIILWFIIYISFGALWGAYGLVNGKEFAIDFVRLNTLWVVVYFFLILMINKPEHLEIAQKIMIWATLAIAIYNINYALYGMGYVHIPSIIDLDMGQRVGIHPGYIQLTAHNLGSLVFLFPFVFSGIAIAGDKGFAGLPRWFSVLVLILCLIALFLSGRRSLWFITLLVPFIYYVVIKIITNRINRSGGKFKQWLPLIILGILIVAGQYYLFHKAGWDSQSFIDRFTFSGEQAEGYDYRINKITILTTDVYEHSFLIGTGGGNPAFEVTFIQLFHETGIIGLMIFVGLFLWVYLQILKLVKRKKVNAEQGIPLLIGSICFFLGMGTNPYYGSFDFMWSIFLPLAYVNIYLRRAKG